MASDQIGIEEAQAGRRREGAFLTPCTPMVCSGIAIAFVLISWAVGGHGYARTFYGDVVLGLLVACFLISAAFYGTSPER
jgi:Na+/melibiose symporter-like transporter